MEARGSLERRRASESDGIREAELAPLIWMAGTGAWTEWAFSVEPFTSREALRSSGKRDVRVRERRRSAGRSSLTAAAADGGGLWLCVVVAPETARTGRGRDWLADLAMVEWVR